jgi:acetyltransferase-like isoleucine patch superfamily enzyme
MASLLGRITRRISSELATSLGVWIRRVDGTIARRTLPQFANNPKNLTIELPRRISNPKSIVIGDDVWLGPNSFLSAVMEYPGLAILPGERRIPTRKFTPRICIGHRVTCTGSLLIGAVQDVMIEDDVLIASNVTILDHQHGYENASEPYKYQPLGRIAPVLIRRGTWIGQNVVILSGVTIGELAIIGANSVVTHSIPDRCIAVGTPAKVTKRWDERTQGWMSCRDG